MEMKKAAIVCLAILNEEVRNNLLVEPQKWKLLKEGLEEIVKRAGGILCREI